MGQPRKERRRSRRRSLPRRQPRSISQVRYTREVLLSRCLRSHATLWARSRLRCRWQAAQQSVRKPRTNDGLDSTFMVIKMNSDFRTV